MKLRPVTIIPKFFEGQVPPVEAISKKDFDDLTKLVKGLTTVVQTQSQVINQLRQQPTIVPTPTKGADPEDEDEPDLETMGNKDFAAFLMKNVGKILDTKLGEFNTRLDKGLGEVRNGRARDEIEKFRAEHKDFDEWATELGALAKQHPSLGISQLYTLARSSDPEKVKTVDEKYAEKVEKPNPEDDRLTLFGGFRPSTGKSGGDGAGDDGKQKMSVSEALEKSWSDAVSKFPALKQMGDDSLD